MPRALTAEQVKERLVTRGITLVSKWRGRKEKHTFRCEAGHNWRTTANHPLYQGSSCPKCYKEKNFLTTEKAVEKLALLGITFSGKWRGPKHRYRLSCTACGHKWLRAGSDLVRNGCPGCAERALLTTQDVNKRLKPLGIRLVGKWNGKEARNRFVCSKGHKWEAGGGGALNGTGCPTCYNARRKRLTTEEVNQRLVSQGLRLKGKWKGSNHSNTYVCSNSHEWKAKGNGMLLGGGCPQCASNHKLTVPEVNERLKPRGIRLVGKWNGSMQKSRFICLAGHKWTTYGHSVVNRGGGCPKCNRPACIHPLLTLPEIKVRLEPLGLKLLGKWHGSEKTNLFQCALGHTWETQGRGPVVEGSGCPECDRLRRKNRHAYA